MRDRDSLSKEKNAHSMHKINIGFFAMYGGALTNLVNAKIPERARYRECKWRKHDT